MYHAREITTGRIVHADDAIQLENFACPVCGVRVNFRAGSHRRPHFAHNPGEATPECDLFQPGSSLGAPVPSSRETVLPLQLFLSSDHTVEPFIELVLVTLGRLSGPEHSRTPTTGIRLGRGHGSTTFSAGDLRPGRGRNTTPVPLPESDQLLEVSGLRAGATSRPPGRLPALAPRGTVFVRHLGGNFRRHDPQWAPVHWGDDLIVLAKRPVSLPRGLHGNRLPDLRTGHSRWHAVKVTLPKAETIVAKGWLADLQVEVEPAGLRPRVVSVPDGYAPDGNPMFGIDRLVTVTAPVNGTVVATDRRGTRTEHGRHSPSLLAVRSSTPIDNVRIEHPARIPFTGFEFAHLGIGQENRLAWSAIIDGRKVPPHTRTKLETVPKTITLSTAWDGLTFTVQVTGSGGEEQVHSLDAAAATVWLQTRLSTADRVVIEHGNLGSITIEQVVAARPLADSDHAVTSTGWMTAYASATANRANRSRPHWVAHHVEKGNRR